MSTMQELPLADGALDALPVVPEQPRLRLVPDVPLDFDDAVRRLTPRLQRYAARRLGDVHEAEELVQEALLRAYRQRDQLLTEDDLAAWTTVVTGRLVIDRLRVRNRSVNVAEVPEGSRVGRDTADVVVARDEARLALDALDAMPARQASLLWAREVEGKSYEELCEHFGMTEPAVRSVLTRARKALRREYELRGGTVPVGGLAVLAPWIAGLTWAEKLRRCANKITAPAVLGAAGIAALGGLVLSPFGSDHHATTTFAPATAVVASALESTPAARDLQPATTRSQPARPHVAAATPTAVKPQAHGLRPHNVPAGCQNVGSSSTSADPNSAGVGQASCIDPKTGLGIGPDLPQPVDKLTGYDHVRISSSNVQCTQVATLTQSMPQLITCSESKS